ncbi:MAG: HAD family hydrolase [Promethearchaeota archaeon]
MNFDFYIFDLDGTLLDLGNIRNHADYVLVETLKKLNPDEFPNKKMRNELWISGTNFQQVLSKWGLFDSIKFWKCYDKTDFERRKNLLKDKKIRLYDNVEDVLKYFYHNKDSKKMAICTNTANYIVDYFLKFFKIYHYFHEIFSMVYDNQNSAKPSPKGILNILAKFKYTPYDNSVLMVGDSIHDIKAANSARISSCLIDHRNIKDSNRYSDWEIQPDYVINNIKDLIDL